MLIYAVGRGLIRLTELLNRNYTPDIELFRMQMEIQQRPVI